MDSGSPIPDLTSAFTTSILVVASLPSAWASKGNVGVSVDVFYPFRPATGPQIRLVRLQLGVYFFVLEPLCVFGDVQSAARVVRREEGDLVD